MKQFQKQFQQILTQVIAPWFLLLRRIHFPSLFPDFPERTESFTLTNLFMRNTNVGFQPLAIALKKVVEQILKWRYK